MKKDFFATFLVLFVALYGTQAYAKCGKFEGDLVVKDVDGFNLKLVEPYTYVDCNNKKWIAPKGMITDGASIPQALWSFAAPFTGQHRKAAIIHDHLCQIRKQSWRKVHELFYEAMLAAGVNHIKARVMYGAVYAFGPRWSLFGADRGSKTPDLSKNEQKAAFGNLQKWIKKNNPSPKEIEQYINKIQLRELGSKANL